MTITDFPAFTQSKNNVDSDVSSSGTVSTDNAVQMTISAEGTAHIMSLLTDLYSSPELAVLREYSSNAKDSHAEAGQTLPVKVTLPSTWNPVFTVQDFGVGMSSHDIKTIYSSYGASTKQKDFSQVGAFGLGCKSALSLTQQFTLISIKDGRKSTVLISRGDDGVGSVNVVSEVDTADANGVTVSVPIENVSTFNQHVPGFFFTWEPGSVLVDGNAPLSIFSDNFMSSADKTVFLKNVDRYSNNHLRPGFSIVMGGMTYSINTRDIIPDFYSASSEVLRSVYNYLSSSAAAFAIVPIGSVDLTPSREGVRYSDRTNAFLTSLFAFVVDQISVMLSEMLSGLTTRAEVIELCYSFNSLFNAFSSSKHSASKITWNGEEVPQEIRLDAAIERLSTSRSYGNNSSRMYKKANSSDVAIIPISSIKHYYFVESDSEKRSRLIRDLHLYLERSSIEVSYTSFYVFKEEPASLWITDNSNFTQLAADDIITTAKEFRKEIRAESRKNGKTVFQYWVLFFSKDSSTGGSKLMWEHVDSDDVSKDAYLVEKNDFNPIDQYLKYNPREGVFKNEHLVNLFEDFGIKDGDSIVCLRQGQTDTALTKRVGATLKTVSSLKNTAFATFIASIPKESKHYLDLMGEGYGDYVNTITNILSMFRKSTSTVDDDSLLLSVYKSASASLTYKDRYARLSSVNRTPVADTSAADRASVVHTLEILLKKYPLLNLDAPSYSRNNHTPEIYFDYINMIDEKERNNLNVISV